MKAIILGAGRGTRLGSLGKTIPKVLIEVGGERLLERQLRYLERNGIHHVVVNAHHQAAQITSFVEAYSGSVDLTCVIEERLLGTAGGVRNALEYLQPGPFVVLYGDVIIDAPIEEMLRLHRTSGASGTLAVHEAHSAEGKGVVEVDESGRIRRFTEKGTAAPGPVLINSGLYVIESEMVADLPQGVESDFGRDVFPDALRRGLPLYALSFTHPVTDIGTSEGLARARSSAERELESDSGRR
jgi:NDP-sugar pyrophosphorylase family protein